MKIGLMTATPSRELADLVRRASRPYIIVDAEGTQVTPADSHHMVSHLRSSPVSVMARVPIDDLDPLADYAGTGLDEIVLPQVRSADQVTEVFRGLDSARLDQTPALSVILENTDSLKDLRSPLPLPFEVSFWIGMNDPRGDLRGQELPLGYPEALLAATITALRAAGRDFGLGANDLLGVRRANEAGAARCSVHWEAIIRAQLFRLVSEFDVRHLSSTVHLDQGEAPDAG